MLKKQIELRLKAKNLSIAKLERLAGLKIHAVRNIIKRKIKKPNTENLLAIANVLECSIADLMAGEKISKNLEHNKTALSENDFDIRQECQKAILSYIEDHKIHTSVDEFFKMSSKVYGYSAFEGTRKFDHKFMNWTFKEYKEGK